jgi:signal transduction histidine kinase
LVAAAEFEQREIGQELHDGLCQDLAGIAFLMQSLQRKLERTGTSGSEEAKDISELLCQAVSRARGLSHGLYPVSSQPNGLVVALRRLAEDTTSANGVRCEFSCTGSLPSGLDDAFVANNLFRIAQDAVRCSQRIPEVKSITIHLSRRSGWLSVAVTDDRGTQAKQVESEIAAHRAKLIEANLRYTWLKRGRGFRVTCVVPRKSRSNGG